jgi:hypothetical protein
MARAGAVSVPVACVLALVLTGAALADGTRSAHAVSQLSGQAATTVTYEGNRVTVTFGPGDLLRQHLHHILLINQDKESVSCPGEHQIYHSAQGFGVNTHDPQPNHGMGNYLLYMTPGECQVQAATSL